MSRKLVAIVLAFAFAGRPVGGQESPAALHFANLGLAENARVMGFSFELTGGRVTHLDPVPDGWNVVINNDPSWRTSIKGHAIVGAASLSPTQLMKVVVIEAAPGNVSAELRRGVTVSGSVTLMQDGNLHTLRLSHPELASVSSTSAN